MIHLTHLRWLEFNDVSGEVRVSVVGRLPAELDGSGLLVQDLESERRLGPLLDDQVDGGVVRPEGVGSHAGEKRRVFPLGALDANRRKDPVLRGFLPDGVSRIVNFC